MVAAVAVFVLTLSLVIIQPRGLGIGWSAAGGAALALALGIVNLHDVPLVIGYVWNATLTLIGVLLITLVLDEAGFFRWSALGVGRLARGNGTRLFVLVVLFGAVTAALFTNDGAVLILTPTVLALTTALRLPPPAVLAFVMAAGFISDAASLPLVVSNLTNIITADYFGIGFNEYAAVMIPVNLVAVAASLSVLWLMYRKTIPRHYDRGLLPPLTGVVKDELTFRTGFVILALLLAGFMWLEPLGVPVSAIALTGAAMLLITARRGRVISIRRVVSEAPWQVILFSLGMYIVVFGLRNAGLTDLLAQLSTPLLDSTITASLGFGALVAGLSSVLNNLPAVLIGALTVDAAAAEGAVRSALIYANIVGSDIGPKMTPIGSLATLLWLHVLRRRGVLITWGHYFSVGIRLTLPVLAASLLMLGMLLS